MSKLLNQLICMIDIDNIICTVTKSEIHVNSIPDYKVIHDFNKLYEIGNQMSLLDRTRN